MAQQILNVGTASGSGDGEPLRTGMVKVNANFTELYNGVEGQMSGFFDYNDTGLSVPITSAGSPVIMTNDELGAFTNKAYAPLGVTDVWDSGTNMFDWSELKLGDTVDVRLEFNLTTVSVNTQIHVDLHLGTGGGAYSIPFVSETDYKNTGTRVVNVYNGIYMGNINTLDNGGQFKISTDKDCSIVVRGWYCKITKR
jgi:hypothetical protein